MTKEISAAAVRALLLMREEVALLDLREEAVFALAHPLFAAQLSAGRIEMEILDRVPRPDTRIVLYDDGEGLVGPAADRLERLGYPHVFALQGGLAGWRGAGYELFQDVNSYSKAFGELVEHRRATPSLPAPDVQALIDAKADIAVLDARRFDEYATMNIPSGTSVPGAELVLRARAVAPDPETLVVVNCAGRTRSIIGAQSLINAGLPNRVVALRNGTIGWTLAGQTLETGQQRQAPMPEGDAIEEARARARDVAYRAGVRRVSIEDVDRLGQDPARTLYRFDVRTPEEYRQGHIRGFRNAPGGQLVQEADMFAPVRGARIVLADDVGPRADMTASWLAQMGWDVYVLEGGFDGALDQGDTSPHLPPVPSVATITPEMLDAKLANEEVVVIDLAPSSAHRRGHIPGARFALRVELETVLERLPVTAQPVLTSPDGTLACFAAAGVPGPRKPLVLAGGTAAWHAAGLRVEPGFDAPLSEPRDVYKRPYEGTGNAVEAMQAYLDWEYGLVEQLARDGTHGFVVI